MALDPKKPLYKCEHCAFVGDMPIISEGGNQYQCQNCLVPFATLHPKRMLFVDDRSKRIHWALENYCDEYEVTIAPCVPEALRLLSSQEWDVVSLDHDLNGHDFQDPLESTSGMEILRYMQKCGGTNFWNNKPKFWLHTSNTFAAALMEMVLAEMGFVAQRKPVKYEITTD